MRENEITALIIFTFTFAYLFGIYVGRQWGKADGFARGKRAQEALHDVKKHCGILSMLFLLSLVASDAHACNKCGRFGNQCAFVAHHAVAVQPLIAVTPVAAIQQPSVFVVQNTYPSANAYPGQSQGLPLTAQQGNTQYGYTLSQALQPVDPAQLAFSIKSMYDSATSGAPQAFRLATEHMNAQLAYSHAQAMPIAQATAAKIVLDAAGIHPQAQQFRQQQTGYKITFDASGQPKVEPLQAEQIQGFRAKYPQFDPNGYPGQKPPCDPVTPTVPTPANQNSMLALKCASCHGTATPKAGLFIDGSQSLDCKLVSRSRKAIKSGVMPKDETLSEIDKQKLLDELDNLAIDK